MKIWSSLLTLYIWEVFFRSQCQKLIILEELSNTTYHCSPIISCCNSTEPFLSSSIPKISKCFIWVWNELLLLKRKNRKTHQWNLLILNKILTTLIEVFVQGHTPPCATISTQWLHCCFSPSLYLIFIFYINNCLFQGIMYVWWPLYTHTKSLSNIK